MGTQVQACPKCFQLMWLKEAQFEYVDDATIRTVCPHCKATVRVKLITEGANSAGPKMGH